MERITTLLTKSISKGAAKILVVSVCVGGLYSSLAQAQPPIMVGMGDSIGEAVQSADANLRTQRFSYLKFLAKQMGIRFPLPLIRSSPFGVVGDTTSRCRLWPDTPALNLSVSGADVDSLLTDRADALDKDEIDSETDLVLFPRVGSQMEIAESIGAPFVVCWIGNNDVLSTVLSFDQLDASQMTPVDEFEDHFQEIARRLGALGVTVVFANIPDVTRIGFLVDREDLIKFLGSDFGLGEGDFTTIVVMLLIRLGLDGGSLLKDPDFVLDAGEVELIQERIEIFNDIIETAAFDINAPVVDINAMFDDVGENPPIFFGIPIMPRFLGGIFSLDGVHPSNIGHALAANAFIQMINSYFQADIPLISDKELRRIFLRDPFQDKDGDGRARGRFGAGLLETLGPVLGISGDRNDLIPEAFPAGGSPSGGNRFIQRYLTLRGRDPRMASEWTKWDAIEAFKYIFRLNVFDSSEK
ncbi:MAG: SGNH/GDSL hydrolase family protein [Thermodesulfobacteriota bacterium]